MPVSITPGCKQFAVIPVPFNFFASSNVNLTSAHFDLQYWKNGKARVSKFLIVHGHALCNTDETTIIRHGADRFIKSIKRCVKRNGPRNNYIDTST